MTKAFQSATSFRQSLESRLREHSKKSGMDLHRIQRKVAFERFLGRVFSSRPHLFVLKGGYALETRFEIARATKDLDLSSSVKILGTIEEQHQQLLTTLREKALVELDDYFQFRVESAKKVIQAAPYGGFLFQPCLKTLSSFDKQKIPQNHLSSSH